MVGFADFDFVIASGSAAQYAALGPSFPGKPESSHPSSRRLLKHPERGGYDLDHSPVGTGVPATGDDEVLVAAALSCDAAAPNIHYGKRQAILGGVTASRKAPGL